MIGPEFVVVFTGGAVAELASLDRKTQIRVDERACALAVDPFPSGAKQLKGRPGQYRIRQGDYRIIYVVDSTAKKITIATIGHRREVYD